MSNPIRVVPQELQQALNQYFDSKKSSDLHRTYNRVITLARAHNLDRLQLITEIKIRECACRLATLNKSEKQDLSKFSFKIGTASFTVKRNDSLSLDRFEDLITQTILSDKKLSAKAVQAEDQLLLNKPVATASYAAQGLKNHGNTCYFNSFLKAFVLDNPALKPFLSEKHKLQGDAKNIQTCLRQLDEAYQKADQDRIDSLLTQAQSLIQKVWGCNINKQQDAGELFFLVFNLLEVTRSDGMKMQLGTMIEEYDKKRILDYVETTFAMMLPFNPKKRTMQGCIDDHFASRVIGERKTKREFLIGKAPSTLLIQLPRFANEGAKLSKSKESIHGIDQSVRVPMSNAKGEKTHEVIYYPQAVVCHRGSLNAGHYMAYVKNNRKWVKHNDSNVNIVDLSAESLPHGAYLIRYTRQK